MKILFSFLIFCCAGLFGFSQNNIAVADSTKQILQADVSCGQCKFGLTGKGCDLAIRINSTAYYVDGTTLDEHGDAHAKDGLCNAIRKAVVQGEVVADRFKVTYFKLKP